MGPNKRTVQEGTATRGETGTDMGVKALHNTPHRDYREKTGLTLPLQIPLPVLVHIRIPLLGLCWCHLDSHSADIIRLGNTRQSKRMLFPVAKVFERVESGSAPVPFPAT